MTQNGAYEISTLSQPLKLPEGFDQIDFIKDGGADSTKDTSCRAILVSSKTNKESLKERRDGYGVLIRRETKQHRIRFRHDISEVNEVENWKKYHRDPSSSCLCNPM
jgi:hypothetical protein